MIGRLWIWRGTSVGGRWLGWSALGVVQIVVLAAIWFAFVPLTWWFASLLLFSLFSWDRVAIDQAGVSWIRGFGPIPWALRRLPPGGQFVVYETFDTGARAREVAYRSGVEEHVVLSCAEPERVRALLDEAAARAWARLK